MNIHTLLAGVALVVMPLLPVRAQSGDALGKSVAEIERLDAMRSSLAATFLASGAPADQQAFAQVCKPVGQTMQQIGTSNGWTMRQVAVRYRNAANRADAEAVPHLQRFERDTTLRSVSFVTSLNGRAGVRYLRRITIEPSCLLCHGDKAKRPAFVAQGYPQDRAFGFRVGELRGAYSVFVPKP
ncbi:MAG: DUF3365 domain-containing protein [Gemmatimonadaceae bacterium]|nr:DUF3365 domain-containing protein [Gemmatimonadaceae bacterium]